MKEEFKNIKENNLKLKMFNLINKAISKEIILRLNELNTDKRIKKRTENIDKCINEIIKLNKRFYKK